MKLTICIYSIYYTQIYDKATIYVNELILTQFSRFDTKYKKLNAKILRKSGWPGYLLEFFWIILQYSIQALRNIKDVALRGKSR